MAGLDFSALRNYYENAGGNDYAGIIPYEDVAAAHGGNGQKQSDGSIVFPDGYVWTTEAQGVAETQAADVYTGQMLDEAARNRGNGSFLGGIVGNIKDGIQDLVGQSNDPGKPYGVDEADLITEQDAAKQADLAGAAGGWDIPEYENVATDPVGMYKAMWEAIKDPRMDGLYNQMQQGFANIPKPPGGGLFGSQFDTSVDPFAPAGGTWAPPSQAQQTSYAGGDDQVIAAQTGEAVIPNPPASYQGMQTDGQGNVQQTKTGIKGYATGGAVTPPTGATAPTPEQAQAAGGWQGQAAPGGNTSGGASYLQQVRNTGAPTTAPQAAPPPAPPLPGAPSVNPTPGGPVTAPGSQNGDYSPNARPEAPQAGGGWRGQQANLAAQMMGYDASSLPSQAAAQLRMGQDQQVKQAMALAGSQSGMSPAAALRSAQRQAEGIGLQTNQQMALLRAQEAAQNQGLNLQARGLAGNVLQQGAGNDIQVATEQQRSTDANTQSYLQAMSGLLSGQQGNQTALGQTVYGQEDAQSEADDNYWRNLTGSILGGLVGAGGTALVNKATR